MKNTIKKISFWLRTFETFRVSLVTCERKRRRRVEGILLLLQLLDNRVLVIISSDFDLLLRDDDVTVTLVPIAGIVGHGRGLFNEVVRDQRFGVV